MISSRWFTPSVLGLVLCVTSIISVWIYGPRAARFDGVCLLHTGLRRAGIRTSTCTTAQLDGMLTIPRRLIFTYGTNLLASGAVKSPGAPGEALILANVRNTIMVNRELRPEVMFLDNNRCVQLITKASGASLAAAFQQETFGAFKGDICRGAALYLYGGFYMDVDIEALEPLVGFVHPSTTFTTVTCHGGFFQAFIGVTARHEVMRTYLRYLLQYYQGTRNMTDVNPHLGVQMLQRAYDDCCRATMNATSQILAEVTIDDKQVQHLRLKPRGDGSYMCNTVVYDPSSDKAVMNSRYVGFGACPLEKGFSETWKDFKSRHMHGVGALMRLGRVPGAARGPDYAVKT